MSWWKPKSAAKPEGAYVGLRQKWLGGEMLAVAPPGLAPDDVVAVLFEFGGERVATVVAARDGTASLYTSAGGGFIGMGSHPTVAAASLALVGCAEAYVRALAPASSFPLPGEGDVAFWLVTPSGVRGATAREGDVARSPLEPLHAAGHGLVTAMRLVDQRGAAAAPPLRIHAGADGAILVAQEGETTTWLTLEQLRRVLDLARERDARVELSVDDAYTPMLSPINALEGAGVAFSRVEPAAGRAPGGATPLHLAVVMARPDLARDLARRGAAAEARDAAGYTPLLLAALLGRTALVRALLDAGADPRAIDRERNSALMYAAQSGDPEAVEILLAAGCDPAHRGKDGLTALKVARLCSQADAAALLERRGAPE